MSATLDRVSFQDVTVNLGFTGTATNPADYTRSESIVITAGNLTSTITLTGADDTTDETDETIVVDIASATNGQETGTQQVTATITDDDDAPTVTLAITNSPFDESGGSATVTATLSEATEQVVTVTLGFAETAANPADYAPSATSVVIAPGATSGSITLTAASDSLDESNETVIVSITSTTNVSEETEQAVTGTITDDDAAPNVTLAVSGSSFAENGGVATVTATLSTISAYDVTVDLALSGDATAVDYAASATSISIPAGQSTGSITLTGTDDALDEVNESVTVQKVRASGGETRYVMTVVGSIAGNFGSYFKTGVQFHTPTAADLEARLVFHPAGRPGSDDDLSMSLKISPNATQTMPDLLEAMGTTGLGTLDLITTSPIRPISVARVYSTSDAGQTSMTEDLFGTTEALSAGQSAVVFAPHDPSTARFNIGVRSLADGAKITAVVRDPAGRIVKTTSRSYPPTYFEQRGAADHLGVTFTGDESVTYTIEEGAAIIYGVWTDNMTQDPSLHFALVR